MWKTVGGLVEKKKPPQWAVIPEKILIWWAIEDLNLSPPQRQ